LSIIPELVKDQRVVLVDDSIIRGTTSRNRIKMLREAGAKEVHLRISCPPHRHPCFYGIDFPTRNELIAFQKELEEIAVFIGVDSLGYLSEEGMLKSVSLPADHYCRACFNGQYPIKVDKEFTKDCLEKRD